MKKIRIKTWFLEKINNEATHYNVFIDTYERDDEFAEVLVTEEHAESEKAIKVRLGSGNIVGSYKGWMTWIPKSVIAA